MTARTAVYLILVLLLVTPAAGQQSSSDATPVWPELTPKLQGLLQQEMVSILNASKNIAEALVLGEEARIAKLARGIEASFIMKQNMTEQDQKDLMEALPEDFVQMDKRFHQTASRLAGAADKGDLDAAHAEFSSMLQQCTACHVRFATDRLEGFSNIQ